MNKIILKIIALGLFLSGCDVFKDVENTAKPLNTTPSTLNKKPPPPPEANFPVTDAIDNIANARSVLTDYLGQEDSQEKPTDLPDVKVIKKKIRQVKTENILKLSKNGDPFLNHLANIGDDTERSSIIAEVADGLDKPPLFIDYVNKSNIVPELLAKKADQSLRELMSRARTDINNLELPDDNESKKHLVSLTTDPVITDKIIGPNKEAFIDTMLASVDTDNDKKIKILANLKNGLDPAEDAKIENKQVLLAQNILDDATENIEKIGNLDTIKNSIGDLAKKASIEDKQVALTENIVNDAALDIITKSVLLQNIKPSLLDVAKKELIEDKEVLLADQIAKDPDVANNEKIDHLIDLKPTMSDINKDKIEQKLAAVAHNLVSDETIDFDSNMQMIAKIKNSLDTPLYSSNVDFHKQKLADQIIGSAEPVINKVEKLQKIKASISINEVEKSIEDKQVALAQNILADAALSVDDKADALNALKPSLLADKKQEIEVAQVATIFSDEAKLLDPAVLVDELNKNNLRYDEHDDEHAMDKYASINDQFKVDGNQDNLVGFYVAKLGDVELINKQHIISELKNKINPANNDEWRTIIETSPYLKGTYFDKNNLIKDKQTAELLDYKIEANEVIDAGENKNIADFFRIFNTYVWANNESGIEEPLINLLNNNLISSLPKRNIADELEANEIIRLLTWINKALGGKLNNNLPKNPENKAGLLLLLKNNIAKPKIFNSLYGGLTLPANKLTLADDTEAAFQGLISGKADIVGELAKANMSNVGKVDEVIKTLDILVDASGGKDKFNQALLASKAYKVKKTYPNLKYFISPMYKLLEKDISNKIAYFCLENDVQMINNPITKENIQDMIEYTKEDEDWWGFKTTRTKETPLTQSLKHLLMNNDATRDVYLTSYGETLDYTMHNDYAAYIDFVLANNSLKIEDKFERIKKAARSVYNHNSSPTYRNNAIGTTLNAGIASTWVEKKGYFNDNDVVKEFIGAPSYFWSYGQNNFYNLGKTYQQLKVDRNVW